METHGNLRKQAEMATAKFQRRMSDDPMVLAADEMADALEAALHEAGHACCCEKPGRR